MKTLVLCLTMIVSLSCVSDEDWERADAFVDKYYIVFQQGNCEKLYEKYLSDRYRNAISIESYCKSFRDIRELLGEVVNRRPVGWSSVKHVNNYTAYRIDYAVDYRRGAGKVSIVVIEIDDKLKIDDHRVDSPLLKSHSL